MMIIFIVGKKEDELKIYVAREREYNSLLV